MRNSSERPASKHWLLGDPGSPNVREYSDWEVRLIEERMDTLRHLRSGEAWDEAERQLRAEGDL